MAYFAELNSENKVLRTILINNDVINNANELDGEVEGIAHCKEMFGQDTIWKQTSFNTRYGIHFDQNHEPDNKPAIRGNFALEGMIYDEVLDAFYFKDSPHPSWVFDDKAFAWKAPVDRPNYDKFHKWNEEKGTWEDM